MAQIKRRHNPNSVKQKRPEGGRNVIDLETYPFSTTLSPPYARLHEAETARGAAHGSQASGDGRSDV